MLSDETRLRCFRLLAVGRTKLCVAEFADILQKPQYAISRSLAELRKAGLIQEERQGKFVFYSIIEEPALMALAEWVVVHGRFGEPAPEGSLNADGSHKPGVHASQYDDERLRWRLSIREDERVILTYPKPEDARDRRCHVLFICVHNSARSQLAEEYLRAFGGDRFSVESAGLTPGDLNVHVVALLKEEGIDIALKKTQSIMELFAKGRTYDWVITVCSREAEKDCPIFPGPVHRLSWPFEDPSEFRGTDDEIMEKIRSLAARIKAQVQGFIACIESGEIDSER
jgi:arsenate reductase (thioredoxin)